MTTCFLGTFPPTVGLGAFPPTLGLGGLPPTGFKLVGIGPADIEPADLGSLLATSFELADFGPVVFRLDGFVTVDFGPADLGVADFEVADFRVVDFGPVDFGVADFGPADLGSFPAITFWGLGTLPSILIVWDKILAAPVEVGRIISSSLSSKGFRLTSCGPVSTRDVSRGSREELTVLRVSQVGWKHLQLVLLWKSPQSFLKIL